MHTAHKFTGNGATTAVGNFGDISLPRAANYFILKHSTGIANVPSQQISRFYTGSPMKERRHTSLYKQYYSVIKWRHIAKVFPKP
jgi:hypothetical protein